MMDWLVRAKRSDGLVPMDVGALDKDKENKKKSFRGKYHNYGRPGCKTQVIVPKEELV